MWNQLLLGTYTQPSCHFRIQWEHLTDLLSQVRSVIMPVERSVFYTVETSTARLLKLLYTRLQMAGGCGVNALSHVKDPGGRLTELMSLQIRPRIATCHHVDLELTTSWCHRTRDEQD